MTIACSRQPALPTDSWPAPGPHQHIAQQLRGTGPRSGTCTTHCL